jgi:acetylglutamate synthase
MPDQEIIERVQQEVHTANHVRKYEQEKKAKELEATAQSARDSQALEMQHHNKLVDQSIREGLTLADYINKIKKAIPKL